MFAKILCTKYPPEMPTLVWDGDCGFCKFWKTTWEIKTPNRLHYETYQKLSGKFPDIPLKEFKKASRLIEPDGKVYSGPDSAYRALYHAGNEAWHKWYHKSSIFRKFSDHFYNHIAKNRGFYFKLTQILFGNNPHQLKSYWLLYLLSLLLIILLL
ncbi:thiol-disulfide oxidoreductase DCC family protein [Salegentibacter sp. HM20]